MCRQVSDLRICSKSSGMLMDGFILGSKSAMNYIFGWYGLEVLAGMSNVGGSGQEK